MILQVNILVKKKKKTQLRHYENEKLYLYYVGH